MVTEVVNAKGGRICVHENGVRSHHSEYYWLSTDEKPMEGVENADVGYEMDTKKVYLFDITNNVWIEQ